MTSADAGDTVLLTADPIKYNLPATDNIADVIQTLNTYGYQTDTTGINFGLSGDQYTYGGEGVDVKLGATSAGFRSFVSDAYFYGNDGGSGYYAAMSVGILNSSVTYTCKGNFTANN